MTLPAPLRHYVDEALVRSGLGEITSANPVGGGCINETLRIGTSRGEAAFLKWNASPQHRYRHTRADAHCKDAAIGGQGPTIRVYVEGRIVLPHGPPRLHGCIGSDIPVLLQVIQAQFEASLSDSNVVACHGQPPPPGGP